MNYKIFFLSLFIIGIPNFSSLKCGPLPPKFCRECTDSFAPKYCNQLKCDSCKQFECKICNNRIDELNENRVCSTCRTAITFNNNQ